MTPTDTALPNDSVKWYLLSGLLLDAHNPRFGERTYDRSHQTDILDFIVKTFDVSDQHQGHSKRQAS
ncbi:hypothetical protein [Thiolapillus sp.]